MNKSKKATDRSTARWCAAWIAISACSFAAPAPADQVDDYLRDQIGRLHIPGLSIAVIRQGKTVKTAGYGFADLQLRAAATPDTVYEIGSMTKQFTATAVLLLAQEGRMSLDDPLTKFFPEAPSAWREIRIRHLLTHTSGIQNHVALPGFMDTFKSSLDFTVSPQRSDLLNKFFALPLEFHPGDTWSYDNTGYYLLGVIVEKVSGKSYWDFLHERIFAPLGMQHTRNTDPHHLIANRASGYGWVESEYQNRPILLPDIALSAGALLSTVGDLALWDAALREGQILQDSMRREMWTPMRTNTGERASFDYGFGWFVDSYRRHRLVQHSGGTPGFSSVLYRYLDDDISVVILTNAADRIIDQLAENVAALYVPALGRSERTDPDSHTTAKLTQALQSWMDGHPSEALFTPPMQQFLRTTTAHSLGGWLASLGKLNRLGFCDVEADTNGRILRYKAEFGTDPYWMSARVAHDGRIAQIWWW